METVVYRLGEVGTLGFPIDDPTGEPMPLGGLGLRLVVYLLGADLVIPGYASTGEILFGGVELIHPSIMAFDIEADTIVLPPLVYRAALQVNDGSGWRTLPGGEIALAVRKF